MMKSQEKEEQHDVTREEERGPHTVGLGQGRKLEQIYKLQAFTIVTRTKKVLKSGDREKTHINCFV
tara:strand:- start:1064 stop:1261 length:198 start_codon:yes stop_codon:yes gene_type:complete